MQTCNFSGASLLHGFDARGDHSALAFVQKPPLEIQRNHIGERIATYQKFRNAISNSHGSIAPNVSWPVEVSNAHVVHVDVWPWLALFVQSCHSTCSQPEVSS